MLLAAALIYFVVVGIVMMSLAIAAHDRVAAVDGETWSDGEVIALRPVDDIRVA